MIPIKLIDGSNFDNIKKVEQWYVKAIKDKFKIEKKIDKYIKLFTCIYIKPPKDKKVIVVNFKRELKVLMKLKGGKIHEDEPNVVYVKNCRKIISDYYDPKNIAHIKEIINFLEEIRNNINKILSDEPDFLEKYHEDLKGSYDCYDKMHNDFKKLVNSIFSYDSLKKSQYSYELCLNLNIQTCPYCNRQYIGTVKNLVLDDSECSTNDKKLINKASAELDHYLAQGNYPLFAISFYNLIPSCHICNNLKNEKMGSLDVRHFHPILDKAQDFKFKFESDGETGYKVTLDHNNSKVIEYSNKYFALDILYNTHICTLNDMETIYNTNPEEYIEEIEDILTCRNISYTKKQIEEFLYSIVDKEEFHKYPLSKFKYDFYEHLKALNKKNNDQI